MTPQELVEHLLALPNGEQQDRFLQEHAHELNGDVAVALKLEAGRLLRADVRRSLQVVDLIYRTAELTGDPLARALGLLAEANARAIGLAQYHRAIDLYDEATAIYRQRNLPVEEAKAQVGKVGALPHLDRHGEALAIGQWAGPVLAEHGEWLALATLTMNLGIMQARVGEDARALALFDRAADSYARLAQEGQAGWLWVQLNRAFVLRNLGQFDASIQASETARDGLTALGQTVAAARALQNLALTYFILGRYNEALKQLDQARDVFLADGRQRDAMLVELFTGDCLLQLRRFGDVVEKCQQVRELFADLGSQHVVAQAIVKQAAALAGLGRYQEALAALQEARHMFAETGNHTWMAFADLEIAAVQDRQGRHRQALATALQTAKVLHSHDLKVEEAQAYLVAAGAALAMDQAGRAQELADRALEIAGRFDLASLSYQALHLRARLAVNEGDLQTGLATLEQAIDQLERLRGRLMVEYRADFLSDKEVLYEDAVCLCLDLQRTDQALQYAERAKSRALIDLLAFRLDLSLEARSAADEPLVTELMRLRGERDRLFRRWQAQESLAGGEGDADGKEGRQVERQVLAIENKITLLWHRLLIRNADYARDAALWQVHTEAIQPYLEADTTLVEYFIARDRVLAFVVTSATVTCRQLAATPAEIQRLTRLLRLNLNAVPHGTPAQNAGLRVNAQGLLRQLHGLLVAPLEGLIATGTRLIIVPHGALHYLPFHALFDGQSYLLQRHEVSYLPGASLLRFCSEPRPPVQGLVTFGHSYGDRLPSTVEEARSIAAVFGGDLFLEDEATVERLRERIDRYRLCHLAAHGSFRPDNPLFSGVALAGGWLTTLDIFNLRLQAALVTLSACQTGRSAIGGGDELLGLMRAFLYAGAAALTLTLWTVEDSSTAALMTDFYRRLAAGERKSAALRRAQLTFLEAGGGVDHPYFWAPFFLVGDPGPI